MEPFYLPISGAGHSKAKTGRLLVFGKRRRFNFVGAAVFHTGDDFMLDVLGIETLASSLREQDASLQPAGRCERPGRGKRLRPPEYRDTVMLQYVVFGVHPE
ncbi:MAG: hypothetical protein JOY60_17370 [Burkholderiaceae bacterium]|nr:hypothetical protein [Burkholderiaceae bacterium]